MAVGEQKTVTLDIPVKNLARYDADTQEWQVAAGEYSLQTGSSSRTQDLQKTVLLSL
ncbi:MAG TPA: fibronectin type III-like domain-contianing protein [Pseudomonadales bacterium]|nr:fibronectin type III-like domain-contianing protein [Pseudomonadales bacterium]